MLTPACVVARNPEPLTATVGEEIVMLSPGHGAYFGLNPVGSRIWELLAEPRSVADLCAALTTEFEVDQETCRNEVVRFLDRLAEADLVDVRG